MVVQDISGLDVRGDGKLCLAELEWQHAKEVAVKQRPGCAGTLAGSFLQRLRACVLGAPAPLPALFFNAYGVCPGRAGTLAGSFLQRQRRWGRLGAGAPRRDNCCQDGPCNLGVRRSSGVRRAFSYLESSSRPPLHPNAGPLRQPERKGWLLCMVGPLPRIGIVYAIPDRRSAPGPPPCAPSLPHRAEGPIGSRQLPSRFVDALKGVRGTLRRPLP